MKRKVENYLKQTYGEAKSLPDPIDGHYTFCKFIISCHYLLLMNFTYLF